MPTAQVVPPPPIREPMFTNGIMAVVWVNWFQQIWTRAGAGFANTTQDLEVLGQYAEISNGAVASEVANLQTQVDGNTAAITVNTSDLALLTARVNTLEVLTYYAA